MKTQVVVEIDLPAMQELGKNMVASLSPEQLADIVTAIIKNGMVMPTRYEIESRERTARDEVEKIRRSIRHSRYMPDDEVNKMVAQKVRESETLGETLMRECNTRLFETLDKGLNAYFNSEAFKATADKILNEMIKDLPGLLGSLMMRTMVASIGTIAQSVGGLDGYERKAAYSFWSNFRQQDRDREINDEIARRMAAATEQSSNG